MVKRYQTGDPIPDGPPWALLALLLIVAVIWWLSAH